MTEAGQGRPTHVVVLGAGFAGLQFCKHFERVRGGPDCKITLIDRTNHHLFQPLLYQVAMAGLAAPDIAEPTRSIFRNRKDITVLMDEVKAIDLQAKEVRLCSDAIHFDKLVIAMGGITTYFGNNQWERDAPGLKTINDALAIRAKILTSYEKAESTADAEERRRLTTIVIVGGGPTGVELAGTMAELANHSFKRDFRRLNPGDTKIILLDGGERVLSAFPEKLSHAAKRQLEELGVVVRLKERVVKVTDAYVELKTGEKIETRNVLWGAGVIASPVTATMGVKLGAGGRIPVNPDLSLPGHPDVFAVGDIVSLTDKDGKIVPGVAPAALQMGKHVAKVLRNELRGRASPEQRPPFRYWDKGTMAAIGRNRAVAWIGRLQFAGFFAWLAWLFIHLMFLVSFRDKVSVMLEWGYSYLTYRRGARIIFGYGCTPSPQPAVPEDARPTGPAAGAPATAPAAAPAPPPSPEHAHAAPSHGEPAAV